MTMLTQPPPDAPAPPPSAHAIRSRWKWRALWIVGSFSILVLMLVAVWEIREQRLNAHRVQAISNLRSLSLSFLEFEAEYGCCPDASTVALVNDNTGSKLPPECKTSNDYFRQLFATGITRSESLFYAAIPGCHEPDNVFSGSADALAKGEVGYSYIVGASSAGHPKRPLVVTPLVSGTNRFDPKPFGGYAVILPVDGSITRGGPFHPINQNGEVIDSSGKHILDPANPIWGGVKPVIAWPDL
jgi:hypothetical protein